MKESKDLNKDDVAAPEYKSSLPNIDWNISSIHTVDVALNQAARVRQMLRTRKLQLQLETDIKTLAWRRRSNESNRANLQSTKSAGVQMMTTSPRKSDGCPQTRINELEKKLSDLQQTTEDHADLSAALASEESKERVKIQLHTTTSFVASKFLTVCKWRASSNVAQKRNQVIDHQWRREYVEKVRKEIIRASAREHQNAIIECVEKQVKESVEECKRMLMNRLRPLELQLSRIQCLIQKTKDHHLQSVESMVSSALLSRNGNKMTQLTTTLSPAITARFSPRAGRQAREGLNGMGGMGGMGGVGGATGGGNEKKGITEQGAAKKNESRRVKGQENGQDQEEEEEAEEEDKDEASKKKRQMQKETSDFEVGIQHVGKVVWVESVHCWGTIRFFGKVTNVASAASKKGTWVGVSLSLPKGRNDGTIRKIRYFPSKKRHGIFVRSNNVREHPIEGNPRKRRSRAVNSLETATALKKTLARMVAKHK